MGKIIGIDLGTTNSVVAVMEGGAPKVIPNPEGANTTPSIVAFKKDGERLIGAPAKRQAITNAKNTIYSVKRFMGRGYSEIHEEKKQMPYDVVEGDNQTARIKIDDKVYTPQEISSMTLGKLKQTAEAYLGETVTEAVITVPAYFNDAQRKATKEAGEIAGLTVRRIINEPTAAALAYGLDKKGEKDIKVAVYDLGGGTYDISVLELGDGVTEVLSTNGDTHLGGDNFDEVLIDWIADKFKADEGIDLRKDPMALQRLKTAAEKAKIELSSTNQTSINEPFIAMVDNVAKHLTIDLTRAEFERLVDHLVQRTLIPMEKALKDAKLKPSDIDEVLLVGGSTRIPKVQEVVEKFFGKKPDRTVNPDEVVALGAALQGGVLGGEVTDILLLDVTPLNLSIETLGGVATIMIPANTTIPHKKSESFSTAADNQPSVEIHIVQGDRKFATDNKSLGKFFLDGIPPAPRGLPQIEVTFDIDANGILKVLAKDKGTGKEKDIRIESSSGLTDQEIEKMRQAAKEHAEEDQKRKDETDKLNTLDSLVFSSEKNMAEFGDKISADKKAAIESALEKAKEVHKDRNFGEIEAATEALNKAWEAASQDLYAAQAEAAQNMQNDVPNANAGDGSKSNDGIEDATYEEVK